MQSQPRKISVNFKRSRTDPSMNSTPLFRCGGARTSRMTGVSPLSSSLGTRVCPRFPDPPVNSTFMVFSPGGRESFTSSRPECHLLQYKTRDGSRDLIRDGEARTDIDLTQDVVFFA